MCTWSNNKILQKVSKISYFLYILYLFHVKISMHNFITVKNYVFAFSLTYIRHITENLNALSVV